MHIDIRHVHRRRRGRGHGDEHEAWAWIWKMGMDMGVGVGMGMGMGMDIDMDIGNELRQIINLFNYIQLLLIFAALIHFTKRFKRVSLNQMSLLKRTSDLEDAFRKEFTRQVLTSCTSSALCTQVRRTGQFIHMSCLDSDMYYPLVDCSTGLP